MSVFAPISLCSTCSKVWVKTCICVCVCICLMFLLCACVCCLLCSVHFVSEPETLLHVLKAADAASTALCISALVLWGTCACRNGHTSRSSLACTLVNVSTWNRTWHTTSWVAGLCTSIHCEALLSTRLPEMCRHMLRRLCYVA